MRNDRPLAVCCVVLALLATAQTAVAQRVSSPYRFVERKQDLGPYVGWLSTDRGSADLGPKGGLVYGLQYTIRVSDPLNIGVVGAYFPTERDVVDPSTESPTPNVVGTEGTDLLMIAGRLHLNITGSRTWHDLMPYIFLGLGLVVDLTADTGCTLNSTRADCQLFPRERFDFGTSFVGQLGVGATWLPSERFGLRFTVHDNIWRLKTPEGFFDPEVQLESVPPESNWVNNFQLTTAFTLWF